MPEIWEHTLAEFLGPGHVIDEPREFANEMFRVLEHQTLGLCLEPSTSFCLVSTKDLCKREYGVTPHPAKQTTSLLVYRDPGEKWKIAGFYTSHGLAIKKNHQRRGLSRFLIEDAYLRRGGPTNADGRVSSHAGRAAMVSAYRSIVCEALQHGHPVPQNVVEDYRNHFSDKASILVQRAPPWWRRWI